ncbi:MAG: hypothetical protein ACPLPS_11165, partial [bacterium]
MSNLSIWIDESEGGNIKLFGGIVVGGVLLEVENVPLLVSGWYELKKALGLPTDIEIKWNPGKKDRLMTEIKAKGIKLDEFRYELIDWVSSQEKLWCIVAVMREVRQEAWIARIFQRPESKPNVRDFYCEGLKYVLQRVAEECVERKAKSCLVFCDTPSLDGEKWREGAIRRGRKALEEAYKEWYEQGVGLGPSRSDFDGPLRDLGFHPSVYIT